MKKNITKIPTYECLGCGRKNQQRRFCGDRCPYCGEKVKYIGLEIPIKK